MGDILYSGYGRVSTKLQETEEFQERKIDEWATFKAFKKFKFYKEKQSGKSLKKRVEFQNMILEARANNVKFIIIYKFSRAFRNSRDAVNCLYEIQDAGINFISVSESIDTSTAFGKALFTIISALNQLERDNNAEYITDVLEDKVKLGNKNIGRPPYGYEHIGDKGSGKIKVNDKEADIVKKMFIQAVTLEGNILHQIVKDFEMTFKQVITILSNPSYSGWKFYKGQFYSIKAIPKLIEEEFFIQAVLKIKSSAMIQKRLGCNTAEGVVVLMDKFKGVSDGTA